MITATGKLMTKIRRSVSSIAQGVCRQMIGAAAICLSLVAIETRLLSAPSEVAVIASQQTEETNQNGSETPTDADNTISGLQSVEIPNAIRDKCLGCHSGINQKGELDLSSVNGLLRGGESGEALLDEELDESRLWQVLEHDEMPPEGETDLTPIERKQLKEWIKRNSKIIAQAKVPEAPITFHDVLPTLLLRCVSCHGAQRVDGRFDVRTYDTLIGGGQSGPAINPGHSNQSLLIQRIENGQCPPRELLLKFFVRRPSKSETNQIRAWIDAGAPKGEILPDVANGTVDPLVSDEDREHWAFKKPAKPANGLTVDDFILDSLQRQGLAFSAEADRDTLIRRVYLDLIGMPPTISQWRRWREDDSPNWYSLLVDELLQSKHYGERWGRYWLDVAGYADSEGGISADPLRPVAWKYRDYVIKSFNQDTPYNQFLVEQLAGDELTDHANESSLDEEQIDQLIATGFLRMGIDETGSRTMNFVPERLKVISDAINIVSSGLMGLTMECARCHSHKYDPIPQRDYYRLKAVFQGAFDEHNWKSFKQRKLSIGTDAHRRAVASHNPPLEKERRTLQAELKTQNDALVIETLISYFPQQSEQDREATLRALRVADNQRTLPQRKLVEKLQLAQTAADEDCPQSINQIRQSIATIQNRIEQLERRMVPPLTIRALWDEGEPSPTYILRRGEHTQAGRWVGPGVPSVLTDGKTAFECESPFPNGTAKTGRRLAFAKWLTDEDHPTTARVLVNRVWHHHFGKGLVKTLENFGVMGASPSHPNLLDWLAIEFMEKGWSIKELHRMIMNSQTYRQSTQATSRAMQIDSGNALYSRMPLRRMDAEALRDSLLLVSDRLDREGGGIPDPVQVSRDGEVQIKPTVANQWRRSIYAQYRRTEIPSLLDTFDYPQMGPNCLERSVSTVSPQALLLLNNQHIRELSRSFAATLIEELSASDSTVTTQEGQVPLNELVNLAYQKAMSRLPNPQELQLGIESLETLRTKWDGDTNKALETYCHVLLNSASFLYID